MWVNRPAIKDGMMTVSQGAGFGLEFDVGMIAKYAVA
jgi:L-alanine-DL-glutamate epimerase-like enolase superfamily enzyme